MKPITYVGEGAAKKFVSWIEQIAKKIFGKFENTVPMIFDEEAKKLYESQHVCYACGGKFGSDKKGDVKVRDHCHFTGRFRGALHSRCNLRLGRTRTIPVIFHNLRGYDSNLFVKEMSLVYPE